jgi:hypothetical protein
MRLQALSFEDWIEHAFGHEVRFQRPQWFFDDDPDWWDPEPAEAVAHLTRLFEEPVEPLYWFTDAQIAQGLTYLVSTSASGDNGWLYAFEVPIADRIRCVDAVVSLFAKLFLPRCTADLSHLNAPVTGPLNIVCYMWWDEFPCIALPDDPHYPTLHRHALKAMERILALDSIACQESALHGLGHWRGNCPCPAEVTAIVDRFLESSAGPQRQRDARLVAYAKSARSGCVL